MSAVDKMDAVVGGSKRKFLLAVSAVGTAAALLIVALSSSSSISVQDKEGSIAINQQDSSSRGLRQRFPEDDSSLPFEAKLSEFGSKFTNIFKEDYGKTPEATRQLQVDPGFGVTVPPTEEGSSPEIDPDFGVTVEPTDEGSTVPPTDEGSSAASSDATSGDDDVGGDDGFGDDDDDDDDDEGTLAPSIVDAVEDANATEATTTDTAESCVPIQEFLCENEKYNLTYACKIFEEAMPNLQTTLHAGEGFTFFAALDEAVEDLDEGLESLTDKEAMDVMLFSVVKDKAIMWEELICSETLMMASGHYSRTFCRGDEKDKGMIAKAQKGGANKRLGNNPWIVDRNNKVCEGGIVQIVDELMLPNFVSFEEFYGELSPEKQKDIIVTSIAYFNTYAYTHSS